MPVIPSSPFFFAAFVRLFAGDPSDRRTLKRFVTFRFFSVTPASLLTNQRFRLICQL